MSEVKPQLVWLPDGFGGGEHVHVYRASDYDALVEECERLREVNRAQLEIASVHGAACADIRRQRDAALAELAALKGGQGAVSKLQWPEIVGLVNEVLGCEAHKFPCSRGSIGHEMTGINFNSLARIIDRVRHRYTAPPAQASAWVAEGLRVKDALLMWNRRHEEPPIKVGYEYGVAQAVMWLMAAPTPGASDGKGGE